MAGRLWAGSRQPLRLCRCRAHSLPLMATTPAQAPPPLSSLAQGPLGAAQAAMQSNRAVAFGVYGVVGFLGVTFLITLGRMAAKWASPQAKRDRTINKNKVGRLQWWWW